MIHIHTINDTDMQNIIDNKDIPDSIKNKSENVIAIFTQDWCGDWHRVQNELEKNKDINDIDIDVFICVYNQSALHEPFMNFKESVWNNDLIPYLRFYKNGNFIKDSNIIAFFKILEIFKNA